MKTGYISNEFIDDLLNNIDIINIIGNYLPLKKRGENYIACCPFHEEKTPSFTVSSSKQFYYCFGCGAGGNIISFLMQHEHLQFQECIEMLAQHAGYKVPYRSNGPSQEDNGQLSNLYELLNHICQYYQHILWHDPRGKLAQNYLKSRGLSAQICKTFNLGYAPPGWNNLIQKFGTKLNRQQLLATGMVVKKENGNYYDRYRNRIMFPIYNRQGRITGFGGRVIQINESPKYLNSPKTILFNKSRELYGFYEAIQQNSTLPYIVVVEGYLDVISLVKHGIPYVVATLGTATTRVHLQLLSRYTNTIIFCFDGDLAGKKAAWKALEISLGILMDPLKIKFMFLSEHQDPDSFIQEAGKARFQTELNSAMELPDFFFTQLQSQVDLQTMNGKSTLMSSAMPLLAKIKSDSLRLIMMRQLASIVDIGLAHLMSLSDESYNQKPRKQALKQPHLHPLPPMQVACALLLQNPSLGKAIRDIFDRDTLKAVKDAILSKLLDLLSKNPHLTTGALIEFWRNDSDFAHMVELANWQHHVPASGIEAELIGAVQRVLQHNLSLKINKLIEKSNSKTLTNEERYLLQRWIKTSKITHTLSKDNEYKSKH